jgi:TatD DNase family protein
MLVDSHCHLNLLDLTPYHENLGELIEETKRAGVEHLLCVGIDLVTTKDVLDIAERFNQVSASVGLHPSTIVEEEPTVEALVELAKHPRVVAIGETGLDYYHNTEQLELMRDRFRRHIQAALQLNKPVIVHSRNAQIDTIRILQEEKADRVRGVMHCFTESIEMAEQAMALNFYISISGIVTFANAGNVASVARQVPLDRLLIETDSPYLTPVPYRGKKKNEPKYVRYVAERIAELKGISFEEVAKQTTQNYDDLFGRPE